MNMNPHHVFCRSTSNPISGEFGKFVCCELYKNVQLLEKCIFPNPAPKPNIKPNHTETLNRNVQIIKKLRCDIVLVHVMPTLSVLLHSVFFIAIFQTSGTCTHEKEISPRPEEPCQCIMSYGFSFRT